MKISAPTIRLLCIGLKPRWWIAAIRLGVTLTATCSKNSWIDRMLVVFTRYTCSWYSDHELAPMETQNVASHIKKF